MSYFKAFILTVITTFFIVNVYSDFVEITDQIGPKQRDFSVAFIALNNDPYNQVIAFYDNLHRAILFKFNSMDSTMSNITFDCGIEAHDLNDVQSMNFVNDKLMAICYGDSTKSAKLYFLQENCLFSDMTVDSGISPVDLEKAQAFIYFDSASNRNSLSIFICYCSASGKSSKLFEYDQDNNRFYAICEIEFPFLSGVKSINCGNNQLMITYPKMPAKLFAFCDQDKSFVDISAKCGVKAEDLQSVRFIGFSNGQLVFAYCAHGDNRTGRGRQRSVYDQLPLMDYENNREDYKPARLYQINPENFDGVYISSDCKFVDDQALHGATCIKFMKAFEGVIAFISYVGGSLRVFHDPDALFYEKKSTIKSADSFLSV